MALAQTMRALVIDNFGGPEVLKMKTVSMPPPQPGQVIIKVKAFGINRAEMYMRRGEWAESMPIIGIECVGVIASPNPIFPIGTPVVALMGGLGRTINGSYAEYTSAPVTNVVKLADKEEDIGLSWEQIAAIPETFATAWQCLFGNLEIKSGQRLLIRGGTSSLGRAAIVLARNAGVEVTATTRKPESMEELKFLGAKQVILEDKLLSERLKEHEIPKFDALLNLIGNSVIIDSFKTLRRGGRLCLGGFLGGLSPIEFNPLLQMASGVHFSFFGSFVIGNEEFPLSEVPMGEILESVKNGEIEWKPSKVFYFGEASIREAHRMMETGGAGGKMVVVIDQA
jgi:NADPH:quinone reductase-like Zn-dependent oxidoreductase